MMKSKGRLRPITRLVLYVLVAHLSNVNGCSKKSENTESPDVQVKDCPEHVCNDDLKCYTHAQQCDNIQDCDDNTDEDVGHCDKNGLPTFKNVTCPTVTTDPKWEVCIEVKYPNDGKVDYMLLEDGLDPGDGYGWLTYKGEMKEEKVPIVFSWPDEDDGEINATAQFHSIHVATCTHHHIDLIGKDSTGASNCKEGNFHGEGIDTIAGILLENETTSAGPEIAEKNSLHWDGYELNLDVYFDDDMADVYGGNSNKARQKLKKTMSYVEESFLERDTLQTQIKLKVNVEHKKGQRWGTMMGRYTSSQDNTVWNTLARIANGATDKHLYTFVTSQKGASGAGGWAWRGSLCDSGRTNRVNINRYYTATETAGIIAHEIGHNINMPHDFIGTNKDNARTDKNGNKCYGYMDYFPDTNFWSTCNVEALTKQDKSCLKKINPNNPDDPGTPGGCTDTWEHDCTQYQWACKNHHYPWYPKVCQKTCKVSGC